MHGATAHNVDFPVIPFPVVADDGCGLSTCAYVEDGESAFGNMSSGGSCNFRASAVPLEFTSLHIFLVLGQFRLYVGTGAADRAAYTSAVDIFAGYAAG